MPGSQGGVARLRVEGLSNAEKPPRRAARVPVGIQNPEKLAQIETVEEFLRRTMLAAAPRHDTTFVGDTAGDVRRVSRIHCAKSCEARGSRIS